MPPRTPNPFLKDGLMLLSQSEYSERLMRVLGLKGDLPQYLDPRYGLAFTADDYSLPEWSWPRRMSRWSVGGTGVAGAGVFSIFAFAGQNVAGRNTMGIVDSILVSNPSAATISLTIGLTMSGSGGVALTRFGQILDDRQYGNTQSAYAAGTGQNAASPAPAQGFLFSVPAGGSVLVPVTPVVMTNAPNIGGIFTSGIVIVPTAVNTGFQAGITWRERQLSDSEIT